MTDIDRGSRRSPPRPAGGNRATLRDVANWAGVHPSLVSRVVNDDPKALASAATRKRIMDAVRELGYRPHFAARGLRMSRSLTIGLLVPDLSNPIYPAIVHGVERGAQSQGYGVIVGSHPEGSQQETFNMLLEQGRVDALIVASGLVNDKFIRHLAEIDTAPVVSVNRRVRGVRASVTVDDSAGALAAVNHLANLGHRRITGIFGPTSFDTARRRLAGYEVALADRGLTPDVILRESWGMRAGYEGGLELLARKRRSTAVFAPTLSMGIGVLRAAFEIGAQVPTELSVIALHDSELAEYLAPPLTTVAMPVEEMGIRAAELAIGLLEGGRAQHVMLDQTPHIVERSTTAPPHD